MSDYRGRYLWYELLTSDSAKAMAFYTTVLGWTTEASPIADMPYHLWMRGAAPIGGVMELPPEAKANGAGPHWEAYIGTPDLDGTVAAARKGGAQVLLGPKDLPGIGRLAVLADPGGLVFAAYQPAQEPEPAAAPVLGDCSWHELVVNDPSRSWTLFHGLFGWDHKSEAHDMGPMGVYQEYGRPGDPRPLGGIYKKPADMPGPPHLLLYFRVADVARSAEVVKAGGGQVLHGPVEVPGGDFILMCLDPQGAAFALHHTTKG